MHKPNSGKMDDLIGKYADVLMKSLADKDSPCYGCKPWYVDKSANKCNFCEKK